MKPTHILSCLGVFLLPHSFGVEIEMTKEDLERARKNGQVAVEVHELNPRDNLPVKLETERIPEKYAAEKAVAIKLENLKRDAGGNYEVTYRIINPTKEQISYDGYSEISPLTRVQYWKDGKWVDPAPLGICGTGLRDCYVAAGESAVFKVTYELAELPIRTGITYKHPDTSAEKFFTVWSEKIER